jgi:hypothetical protein
MVAREIEAPIELVVETAKMQRLPVVNFAAGGIATPADAALIFIHYIGVHSCECARPSHNCELDNIFKELRIKGY